MLSDNYKAWSILEEDFPKSGSIEEKIKFIVRFGILAPSTHNTQPWRFSIVNNELTIKPDWTRSLPYGDKKNKNIFISLGCCIENIFQSSRHFGFEIHVTINKGENNDVIITFERSNLKNNEENLFSAITKRYSNKLSYDKEKIPQKVLDLFQKITTDKKIQINLTENEKTIQTISHLHKAAMEGFSKDKDFANEISLWLRPNNSNKYDGMPGFTSGLSMLQSKIIPSIIKSFPKVMLILAKKEEKLILESPIVGIISGEEQSNECYILAGRAYERLALLAAMKGIQVTPMHAMVEDSNISSKLLSCFSSSKKNDYMFFRMGYANNPIYHTPRRKIEEFFN